MGGRWEFVVTVCTRHSVLTLSTMCIRLRLRDQDGLRQRSRGKMQARLSRVYGSLAETVDADVLRRSNASVYCRLRR